MPKSFYFFLMEKLFLHELQDIQVNLDNLEQYFRKNSLEFHGIPDEVNVPTGQVVCKIAQAIGVEIQENVDIEISHRIGRKRGDKPVLAKFVSQIEDI